MKTENYLTLCLEQAALSPLHYRHGCVVTRGGKVIGHGFNDYRPGFDGGALKTGRSRSNMGHNRAPGAVLKPERKPKPNEKSLKFPAGFVPFDEVGDGPYANQPLSMHSEMMAIQSALAASRSALSSTALSFQKPCFELRGEGKRKSRLRNRNETLKSYIGRVFNEAGLQTAASSCSPEQRRGRTQTPEWRFEASTPGPGAPEAERSRRSGRRQGQEYQQHISIARINGCEEKPHDQESEEVLVSIQVSRAPSSSHASSSTSSRRFWGSHPTGKWPTTHVQSTS